MLLRAEQEDLCNISLTGMRALVLYGLLIEHPVSLAEIRAKYMEYNIISESNSDDIIRIDLNTLKAFGCEISKATKTTNNKYVLTNHPFALKLETEELVLLKKTYNQIKNNLNIETLIKYDNLFKRLAKYIIDQETKDFLLGISVLKYSHLDDISVLMEDCKYNRILTMLYQPPYSKQPIKKRIATKELVIKNDKIYIYGLDLDLKNAITFNIKRIKKILLKEDAEGYDIKPINLKFIISEFGVTGLASTEKIIGRCEKGYIIEGSYHNEFLAIQRILSLGSSCTVISPDDIKQKIIEILKNMRDIYNA